MVSNFTILILALASVRSFAGVSNLSIEQDLKLRQQHLWELDASHSKVYPVTQRPGFYSVEGLPAQINKSSLSIFRIYGVTEWKNASRRDFKAFLSSRQFARSSPEQQAIHRYLYAVCIKFNDKLCVSAVSTAKGTAFLAGDPSGRDLWTNAHVLIPFAKAMTILDTWDDDLKNGRLKVPIFLFDQKGKLLAGPTELQPVIKLAPVLAEILASRNAVDFAEDFAMVELKLALGPPIPIAVKNSIQMNQTIYKIGFPECTGCKQSVKIPLGLSRVPYPNAVDGQRLFSVGQLFPATKAVREIQTLPLLASDHELLSNEDSVSGESGAPVLNAAGEVVAIHYASVALPLREAPNLVSFISASVRPPQWP